MLQAIQIMLVTILLAIVTGFLVSFLIWILCRLLQPRAKASDEGEHIALAVALAVTKKTETLRRIL